MTFSAPQCLCGKSYAWVSRVRYIEQNMQTQTYTAVLHQEDHWYVAECPEIGVVSQGNTIEEAVANLKEATELYLEEFPPPPPQRAVITTFDVSYA